MNSKQLVSSLEGCRVQGQLPDFQIKGLSCNSGDVSDGFVFVAISGTCEDGHKFIDDAINRGAEAVVVNGSWFMVHGAQKIPCIVVDDTRKALAKLAAVFYGNPSDKIKVVGVTGTNGKTTITYLIEAILQEAGFHPGVIGTVNYRFGGEVMPSNNTTPGPLELQRMFSAMLDAGCDYVVMEVSSHALHQDRVEGVNFHSAIFTNLTQDHLDYHRTIEDYFQAKSRLFKNLLPSAYAVVNNDDKHGKTVASFTKAEVLTYGIDNDARIKAENIKFGIASTQFNVSGQRIDLKINSQLIGRHNVYNILASIAWALKDGIKPQIIKSALEKFSCVPGRLELIKSDNGFSVFVDYAHTDDALFNVIKSLRQVSSGRIIVVFGCGGDRDKSKRPKMGRVVTELADMAIITSDNPRSEVPQAIIDDIKRGIEKDNYCVVSDRREAIKKSLDSALSGDIVLIAGKGHEDYQIIGGLRQHFDDREVVKKCLKFQS